jgi:hypothetical protein
MVLHPNVAELYRNPIFGKQCHITQQCGDLIEVNCGAETDGPLNYYNNRTGELLMRCGGSCQAGAVPGMPLSCHACPPPQFSAACRQ